MFGTAAVVVVGLILLLVVGARPPVDAKRPVDGPAEALGELIAWRDHPGVFHEFRGETLLLTMAIARQQRLRKTLPVELKPLVDLGISPRLDEDDEVIELYLSGDTLTDEAATVKPPCKPLDGPLGSPVEVLRL